MPGRLGEPSPYIAALVAAMHDRGLDYADLRDEPALVANADVLHVHWPEANANARTLLRAVVRSGLYALLLLIFRLRGAAIVWTVHNVGSHEARRPRLERLVLEVTLRCASLVLLPSQASGHELGRRFPNVSVSQELTSLPMFARRNLSEREEARALLDLSDDDTVLVHFGHLRPYKGVGRLLSLLDDPAFDGTVLLLLGSIVPASKRERFAAQLLDHPRVRWLAERYTDSELDRALSAADIAVFPFARVMHSQTVLDALAAGLPVVASGSGSLPELATHFPPGALQVVDTVDVHHLKAQRRRFPANRPPAAMEPDHVWDRTAAAILDADRRC